MHRRLENVYYEVRDPKLSFEDIGNLVDVKAILRQMVCVPFKKRRELLAMGVIPPAGVMMWGPLGNGITMLAEACAKEMEVTFFYISGREMLGKGKDLEEAFRLAVAEAPCLLYLTDVDWLAPRAGADYRWSDGSERGKPPTFADAHLARTLAAMLDMIQDHQGISLLGSCYRIDVVDQAVLRDKDRFNRKVFVPPPTEDDRKSILEHFAGRMPLDGGVDMASIARRTEGFVGWDLESLCKKSALEAVTQGRNHISNDDFMVALPGIRPWLTSVMTKDYFRLYKDDCPHHYAF